MGLIGFFNKDKNEENNNGTDNPVVVEKKELEVPQSAKEYVSYKVEVDNLDEKLQEISFDDIDFFNVSVENRDFSSDRQMIQQI